ncbi:hypothetical protein Bca4012_008742 [Brassica carinata]
MAVTCYHFADLRRMREDSEQSRLTTTTHQRAPLGVVFHRRCISHHQRWVSTKEKYNYAELISGTLVPSIQSFVVLR